MDERRPLSFSVVWHEVHLCGQTQGPFLWSSARFLSVFWRETILCGESEAFLCDQAARCHSLWPVMRPYYVVRCGALLCSQSQGPSEWSGARPFSVIRRGAPMRVLAGSFNRRRAPNHVYNEP